MNNKYGIAIGAVVLIGLIAYGLSASAPVTQSPTTSTPQPTTGTSQPPQSTTSTGAGTVTQKPPTPTPPTPVTVQAKIGFGTTVGNITLLPTQVLEDSRCASGVQCVWAGTVRVNVRIGATDHAFTLGKPLVVAGKTITLVSVAPNKQVDVSLIPSQYVFTFQVK